MRVSFDPGIGTLRLPWGTPQPIRFHDAELDLDLAVRGRGFVEAESAPGGDTEEEKRELRRAAAAILQAQLETGRWTWSDLEKRREALEKAMEEVLAGKGRRAGISIEDIVPDEPSAKAIGEKRALLPGYSLPPAPVDTPMFDGPGAYPQGPGGFGLYRVGRNAARARESHLPQLRQGRAILRQLLHPMRREAAQIEKTPASEPEAGVFAHGSCYAGSITP